MSDYGEIANTLARWTWGMDQRDPGLLRASYTPTARIIMRFPGADEVVVDGREAIITRMQELWDRVAKRPLKQVVSNVLVDVHTPGGATVLSYLNSVRVLEEVPVVTTTGTCRDRFERLDGHWLIAERLHEVDGRLAH